MTSPELTIIDYKHPQASLDGKYCLRLSQCNRTRSKGVTAFKQPVVVGKDNVVDVTKVVLNCKY